MVPMPARPAPMPAYAQPREDVRRVAPVRRRLGDVAADQVLGGDVSAHGAAFRVVFRCRGSTVPGRMSRRTGTTGHTSVVAGPTA